MCGSQFFILTLFGCTLEEITHHQSKTLPGEWVVYDEDKYGGFIHAQAVVNKIDIQRDEVEPTLRKALENIREEYPDYKKFWIWLVPDERMRWGDAAGKLEYIEGTGSDAKEILKTGINVF